MITTSYFLGKDAHQVNGFVEDFLILFFNSTLKWIYVGINSLIQLKCPSEFWLGFLLFRQKCLWKTERGGSREFGNGIFLAASECSSQKILREGQSGPYNPLLGVRFFKKRPIFPYLFSLCKREETVGKLSKWKWQFIKSCHGAFLFMHNRVNLRQ